ncbi:MAG: tRNA (guanosine(46)-N7)-methyltransferase TrmB [Bulleidia sp.]|nr:tRNA (guanosine(46)-N7)-methyltransferase TrmB [Bulleidia sp.]
MRMRKKKWAEPYLEEHRDYAYDNPVEYKGKWKESLNCDVLHLELGMGKGDYLNTMAQMYPQEGFVGVERDTSAAAVAAKKALTAEPLDIHNKRMIVGDAANILDWFEAGEVDVLHLNFSDPWPKTYTHKRRLSSQKFLELYRQILSKDGCVRMKTDNKGLFEDSVLYFLQDGWMLKEFSVDYRRNAHPEDAVTEYEQRFLDLGQPIYQLMAVPMPKVVE